MKLPIETRSDHVLPTDIEADIKALQKEIYELERMFRLRTAMRNPFPGDREEPYEEGLQTNRIVAPNNTLFVQHPNPAPASNVILDVLGAIATRDTNVTLANGANQNIALDKDDAFIHVTGPTGAFSLGGFTGGSPGRILIVFNDTAQTMTVNNLDAGSTATNRIRTLTGGNVALRVNLPSVVTLIYSSLNSGGAVWIPIAYN